jgi:hypothetical protein
LAAAERRGVLSRPLEALPKQERDAALARVLELPDYIGLLSPRELGPVIGRLRGVHALNVLASEALAAAVELGAHVVLSATSPRLEEACAAEDVRCSVRAAWPTVR